jgi:hypothetical protein
MVAWCRQNIARNSVTDSDLVARHSLLCDLAFRSEFIP